MQAVHIHSHTIHTLFAESSHRIPSYSHTIRTRFARSHTIRTVAHYSHGRTPFAVFAQYSLPVYIIHSSFARLTHYSRHCHTEFTHYSHQFTPRSHYSRGGGEPGRTHSRSIRAVFSPAIVSNWGEKPRSRRSARHRAARHARASGRTAQVD